MWPNKKFTQIFEMMLSSSQSYSIRTEIFEKIPLRNGDFRFCPSHKNAKWYGIFKAYHRQDMQM